MPVPIAVAPRLISRSSPRVSWMRASSSARVAPHAANSCPTVIGTASCSWVRPTLGTDQNSRDFVLARLGEAVDGGGEAVERREQAQLHRRRIDVVGALAPVHVVERMHLVVGAGRQAQKLERAVGNDFVGVHVRRRAGPALDHVDDELVVEQAVAHVLAGPVDGVGAALVDQAEIAVGAHGGLFHRAEGGHQLAVRGHGRAGDGEVLERTSRVDAPVAARGDLALPQEVAFGPRPQGRHRRAARSACPVTTGRGCSPRGSRARPGRWHG